MKIIRIIIILIGLGLAAGGVYFLIYRQPGNDLAAFMPAGMMFFFALLSFAVFLPMISGLDHSKLLRTGMPSVATIVAVRDTGSTVNQQPVFRFTLDVQTGAGTVRTTIKQLVARTALGTLRPGMRVPVRYDPNRPSRAAIDSGGASHTAAPSAGPAPQLPQLIRSADVIRDGVAATATVQSVSLTGTTYGQLQPGDTDLTTASDPVVSMTLQLATADGRSITTQGLYRVPQPRLAQLAPGAAIPVAYLAADPGNTTCVDWDRLAAS